MSDDATAVYVGQVECDRAGLLWAVLYFGSEVIANERVATLRKGRRRVADLVLSAADNFPTGPRESAPARPNRLLEQHVPNRPGCRIAADRGQRALLAETACAGRSPTRAACESCYAHTMPG